MTAMVTSNKSFGSNFTGHLKPLNPIIYIPRIADGVFWLIHSASVTNPPCNSDNQNRLLRLLGALFSGRTVQPNSYKREPPENSDPDTANPHPRTANLKTPRVLVVRKVPDSDLPLLVDVGEEWAAVVDAEVEDTMLVGCLERGTKDGSVVRLGHG